MRALGRRHSKNITGRSRRSVHDAGFERRPGSRAWLAPSHLAGRSRPRCPQEAARRAFCAQDMIDGPLVLWKEGDRL